MALYLVCFSRNLYAVCYVRQQLPQDRAEWDKIASLNPYPPLFYLPAFDFLPCTEPRSSICTGFYSHICVFCNDFPHNVKVSK